MAKAHKATYYATAWGDTNGNITSGNLTSVPAGGVLVVEDVHGATAQIGTLSSSVGGRAAGTRMIVGRR